MLLTKALCYVSFSTLLHLAKTRSVPVRQELCERYKSLPACRKLDALTANNLENSNKDQDFCAQYRSSYELLCTQNQPGVDGKELQEFCGSFRSRCIGAEPQATVAAAAPGANGRQQLSAEELAIACKKYGQIASRFCTGNEPAELRPSCDMYRNLCLRRPMTTVTQPGTTAVTHPTAVAPIEPEYNAYCFRNSEAFGKYCSETPTANNVFFCRTYASKCGHLRGTTVFTSAGNPSSVLFRESSHQPGMDVSVMCNMYRPVAERICVGYEPMNMREYCNLYRVFCCNQQPFPIIDGNIGVTADAWGVSGIPFYPFNPQGAIGGGRRVGVGYGDWGARVSTQRGVSDFWDQGRVINANWQRGIYGPARGWGVPLVGIGGFRSNIVKLSGLAAPADYAALLSGGVPPPALPAGMRGLPIPGLTSAHFAPPRLAGTGLEPLVPGSTAALPAELRNPIAGTGVPAFATQAIKPIGATSAMATSPMEMGGVMGQSMGISPMGMTSPMNMGTPQMGSMGQVGVSPFNIGQSRGIGVGGMPAWQQSSGASVNPLQGVTAGRGWGAGPVSGFSGSSVNFGGLPFLG